MTRNNASFLSPVFEKALHKPGTFIPQYAGIYGWGVPVVFTEKVNHTAAGTGLRLSGPENYPGYTALYYGPGAHGTGLQCHIQAAVIQPPVTLMGAGIADGFHLGMSSGIGVFLPAVSAAAYYIALSVAYNASHGHFARL